MHKYFFVFFFALCFQPKTTAQVVMGAEQLNTYLPFLRGRQVAMVVNQTSRVGDRHLVDTLLSLDIPIRNIFAPEHGFRGDHGAGIKVKTDKDPETGIPVISLYGNHKKPTKKDLEGIDIVVFDIQDVGVRFYTYISTMHYVMEACAEYGVDFMVLDRPNPHGHYIAGPVLDTAFRSFIGMHPVPVVHGLTIGEYAQMINGEGWLNKKVQCNLAVITMKNYDHNTPYILPVRPSPNLPTANAVSLYPSICFFEGTDVSLGRGTDHPFECIGRPGFTKGNFSFVPRSIPGVAENPPLLKKKCEGFLLADYYKGKRPEQLDLSWLLLFYKESADKSTFFIPFFELLAGSPQLRAQIIAGKTAGEIYTSWEPGLEAFMQVRKKYLLYQDF